MARKKFYHVELKNMKIISTRKKTFYLFIFFEFLFLFLLGKISWSSFEIYVLDKPYSGEIFLIRGHLYAEAKPLAEELHLRVFQKNGVLFIGNKPRHPVSGILVLNGKSFARSLMIHGKAYVLLKSFVKKTKYKMILNSSTGIIMILPGSSPLTEKNTEIAAKIFGGFNPGSQWGSFSLGSSGIFGMRLPKQVPYLKIHQSKDVNLTAGKFLFERANALYYITILSNWGMIGEARMSQFLTDSSENFQSVISFQNSQSFEQNPKSLIKDQVTSELQLMGEWRNRFAKIVPPSDFLDSYQFSLKELNALISLESQILPQRLLNSGNLRFKKKLKKIGSQADSSGEMFSSLTGRLILNDEEYHEAFQSDVGKLPKVKGVHGISPEVRVYFQQLQNWERRYLFAWDFSTEIFQNIGNSGVLSNPARNVKELNHIASFYSKAQSAFSLISPPPQFRKSNQVLQRLVAQFGSLASDLQVLQQLALNSKISSRGISKDSQEDFSSYLVQLNQIEFTMAVHSNEMEKEAALYLSVLKKDIKR